MATAKKQLYYACHRHGASSKGPLADLSFRNRDKAVNLYWNLFEIMSENDNQAGSEPGVVFVHESQLAHLGVRRDKLAALFEELNQAFAQLSSTYCTGFSSLFANSLQTIWKVTMPNWLKLNPARARQLPENEANPNNLKLITKRTPIVPLAGDSPDPAGPPPPLGQEAPTGTGKKNKGPRSPPNVARLPPQLEAEVRRIYKTKYPRLQGITDALASLAVQGFCAADVPDFERAVEIYATECRGRRSEQGYVQLFSTFCGKGRWREALDREPSANQIAQGGLPRGASHKNKFGHLVRPGYQEERAWLKLGESWRDPTTEERLDGFA